MIGWKKIAGAAALTLACAQAWAVPTLTFMTPSAPAAVGSTVTVDVRISGISDLYSYQFGVNFDNTLLHFDNAGTGSFLTGGDASSFGFYDADPADGTLDFVYDSRIGAQPGASGDGVLATLTFDTLAGGISGLEFTNVLFLDSTSPEGREIAVAAIDGALQINGPAGDVPEPASLALFGIGGVAAFLRRRRAGARA